MKSLVALAEDAPAFLVAVSVPLVALIDVGRVAAGISSLFLSTSDRLVGALAMSCEVASLGAP